MTKKSWELAIVYPSNSKCWGKRDQYRSAIGVDEYAVALEVGGLDDGGGAQISAR